jgi:penicillin-binding protein 2
LADYNGAIVALELKTGGVLAMVSKPDFNPNSFVSGISSKEYNLLRDSADRPLFDRSIRGHYPPASTLKPFVALAGLESGLIKSNSKTFCPGWYKLPGHDHRYRCWKTHGQGIVGLKESLAQSCDVYFYDLANSMGINQLHGFLDHFGFGHQTGIDVPSESSGLSPSREWKIKAKNQVWYPGETLISGIGQGFNQTTPIQLAQATAILAMRGEHIKPKVARAIRAHNADELTLLSGESAESLPVINKKHWESVVDSMVEVTKGRRGTARLLGKTLPFNVAGKTGTAQVFGIKQNQKYDVETLEKKLQDHALFVGFAPAENPEFVVVVVAENGGSGSKVAAPMAKKMIEQYFGLVAND